MPKLNLRDDGFEEESSPLDSDQPVAPPPTLREVGVGGGGGKGSALLTILLIVAALGLGVFALNYFKVVHLWGKKPVKVAAIDQELPLPEQTPATTDEGSAPPEGGEEATPTPEPSLDPNPAPTSGTSAPPTSVTPQRREPAPMFTPPPSGSGNYTVQVSSWTSKSLAEREASRLSAAGMSAFVEDAVIAGENWYRVRVGRYGTSREAKDAAQQLSRSMEGRIWVARIGGK
ncbi:MAG: SPOR domain-containing protein [Bacteroidota bacterium]